MSALPPTPADQVGEGCDACLPWGAVIELPVLATSTRDVGLLHRCPTCGTYWGEYPLSRINERISPSQARRTFTDPPV